MIGQIQRLTGTLVANTNTRNEIRAVRQCGLRRGCEAGEGQRRFWWRGRTRSSVRKR